MAGSVHAIPEGTTGVRTPADRSLATAIAGRTIQFGTAGGAPGERETHGGRRVRAGVGGPPLDAHVGMIPGTVHRVRRPVIERREGSSVDAILSGDRLGDAECEDTDSSDDHGSENAGEAHDSTFR